jgi:RNA polymerase sigma-B factor
MGVLGKKMATTDDALFHEIPGEEAEPQLSDHDLARLLQDPERRRQACEALVLRYRSMIRTIAYHYQLPAQYQEDLLQVGYLGLMKAINNYDPAISDDLKPYARSCIIGEIKRFFRDKRWVMRVSRHDQELLLRAKQAQADLTAVLGRPPTDVQVAAQLNVSTDDLRHAYQAHEGFAPASLDAPRPGSDEWETGDVVGADDVAFDHRVDMNAVRWHWDELPRRQQQILLMRFYGNMSQIQVASRLRCSQMHVSRQQAKALAFLRDRLLSD